MPHAILRKLNSAFYPDPCNVIFLGRHGPNGQLDSIQLGIPKDAIPGSVGASVYITGNNNNNNNNNINK